MSNNIIDNKQFISDITQKRLISDITSLYKNPLNDQGIFYVHDDENILKGYSMIIGPKDTPYENGLYMFEFNFPYDYPYSPPKVVYCTNDGSTRFNPNLYRSGKVCLSLLNTWRGEGWTSCQTIRSVLLTLVTVLNEKPLLNEPGITEKHKDFHPYNSIITYKNYSFSILESICGFSNYTIMLPFINFAKEHLLNQEVDIMNSLQLLSVKYPEPIQQNVSIYNMQVIINYPELYTKMNDLFVSLKNE